MIGQKHLQKMNNHLSASKMNSSQSQSKIIESPTNELQQFNNYLEQPSSAPANQSPQKQQSTSETIKNSIRVIFMFYSSFGDRQNTTILKSNKFVKLLSDGQIIPQLLSVQEADILYHQQTKHTQNLSILQFQQLLPKLAAMVYPDVRVHQALVKLYANHFQEQLEKIMSFTDFGEQMRAINPQVDENFVQMLQPLLPMLKKLHIYVFSDQNKKINKVQWQYLQFLSQFDLLPTMINQSQAQLLFADLLSRPSVFKFPEPQGIYLFQLNPFLESLVVIALMQQSAKEGLESEMGSFRFLLDRIETSKGYIKFQKSYIRTSSEQTKLVAPVDRVMSVSFQRESRVKSPGLKELLNLQVSDEITPYIPTLKLIFESYCLLGEPLNMSYLKGFKFQKLLMNSGLMNMIPAAEVDILYVKLTGQGFISQVKLMKQRHNSKINSPTIRNQNNLYYSQEGEFQNGKMNFFQFLKAIELIGQKINGYEPGSIKFLIDSYFVPMENQLKNEKQEQILSLLVELLRDEQIIQLFAMMQSVFEVYFVHYAQAKYMDLNGFMKFCIEFELSNCLISQSQLMHIFLALSSLNNQNLSESRIMEKKPYLDRHQFVEAISIIGINIYQQEPSVLKRIIYLLEKMNETQGAVKTKQSFGLTRDPQGHNWDLVSSIQEFFQSSKDFQQKRGQPTFDELVEQGLLDQ